ncbi:phosphoribosyl transferase domain protein [Mycobacterium kansasii]|uniref:Phosphoribosyl transferase domain protein n=1 Tax=Mycobacterium kansasii TaxID=1768 RepID=A0A1V3W8U0_MYCKA|nr:phosphoribosyl transferase domain protein [Mycobacterium kansasii]
MAASSSTTMWCGVADHAAATARHRRARGRELVRREAIYRAGRPPLDVAGKTVILVDDGLATGASMFAACSVRRSEPEQIVIAVPAARNPPAGSSPVWSMTSYALHAHPFLA